MRIQKMRLIIKGMAFWERLFRFGIKELVNQITKPKEKSQFPQDEKLKIETEPNLENAKLSKPHPWRLCPVGQHWVRTHEMHTQPSAKNPEGAITIRNGHCAYNPSRKNGKTIEDILKPEEMNHIAATYFSSLSGPPTAGKLLSQSKRSDDYDVLIRGWTKYWNEIFKPREALDPDLVKALIGSESSFNLNPPPQSTKSSGKARGLVQLTDQTIRALSDPNGELKNQLVEITKAQASNANLSIAAAIRWLFHKKKLAKNRLGREATWEEAIAEYKSYLKDMISGKDLNPKGMKRIHDFYRELKK